MAEITEIHDDNCVGENFRELTSRSQFAANLYQTLDVNILIT